MKNNLLEFQNVWIKLCDKATSFSTLSREERIWYTIWLLIAAIQNGGLISFFYNHEAEYLAETIQSLEILDCYDMVNRIELIVEFFPNRYVPKDCNDRNKIIDSWSDEIGNKIEHIDNDKVNELAVELEQKLYGFIKKTNIHQII